MKCGRFPKYIFTASAHFINVGGFIYVINIKTLYQNSHSIKTTRTLISFGGMFVGFSGEIHCSLFPKPDLRLECVFPFLLHIEYGLLVTGQFIIIQRSSSLFSTR